MRFAILAPVLVISLVGAEGLWSGMWSSSRNSSGGEIRIKLKPEPEVTFTINDREVKTKIASQKIAEDSFTLDYDFDLSGYHLRSSLTGSIKGSTGEGTYKTKSLADGSQVDEGTFQVGAK